MSEPDTSPVDRPAQSEPAPHPSARRADGAVPKEPGIGHLAAGAVVGVVVGGTLGFFVAWGVAGLFISVLATVGGALVGGATGGFLVDRLGHRSSKDSDGPREDA